MATILLFGTNPALLEGLSQTLASAGHRGLFAHTLSEAMDLAAADRPLLAVVERSVAMSETLRIPLQAGGAVVVYDAVLTTHDPLPAALARATLAQLVLPLERQRLLALVERVVERSAATGRANRITPPEQRAF